MGKDRSAAVVRPSSAGRRPRPCACRATAPPLCRLQTRPSSAGSPPPAAATVAPPSADPLPALHQVADVRSNVAVTTKEIEDPAEIDE